MIYPTLGRHPKKGFIDFRWKRVGQREFLAAFGPICWASFWRFVKYPLLPIYQRLIRLWLKLHWQHSIDGAPEEYVKALKRESNDIEADWQVANRWVKKE